VSDRVSPTDRIRGHIDELFAQDKGLPEILEDVARLGAQLLMQAALEAEITEFLGRDRDQRAAACEDARPGSRPELSTHAAVEPEVWIFLSIEEIRGGRNLFVALQ
jgi:transposase-like protein